MNRYIPHTVHDIEKMLEAIGVANVEELFDVIDQKYRIGSLSGAPAELPEPHSESAVISHFAKLLPQDRKDIVSFLGAGCYDHFVPLLVDQLASRSEFLTSYTPYQPEISQGTLQSIFEYQTMMCQLTAMEVSNASMYDGATSLTEAVLMAKRIKPNKRVVWLPETVHPAYQEVLKTYTLNQDIKIRYVPFHRTSGEVDWCGVEGKDSLAVVVQTPNFFGILEDLETTAQVANNHEVFFIVVIPDPTVLGLLKPPGDFGADMVVGEAQSLGNYPFFGGPHVGFFTTKHKYVRQMPGRLVGETVDSKGRRAYTLTLSTREQHIRREKATSNICTNQGVIALRTAIYLALLGESGLREVSQQCFSKAEYVKKRLLEIKGVELAFGGATYHEFVVKVPKDVESLLERLLKQKIVGGLAVSRFYKRFRNHLLVSVTEKRTRLQMDQLVDELCRIIAA